MQRKSPVAVAVVSIDSLHAVVDTRAFAFETAPPVNLCGRQLVRQIVQLVVGPQPWMVGQDIADRSMGHLLQAVAQNSANQETVSLHNAG